MDELEWLKEFERKFYKEGGWTLEDLHQEVMDRILILQYTQKAINAIKDLTYNYLKPKK